MANNNQYTSLIYEYFLVRFHSQYYNCGDTLPPIDTLSKEFNVAPQTVKTALRRLRTEGYISMHNGTTTKVIFKQTEDQLAEFILNFFSERWDIFFDIYKSSEQLFVPLLVEGLKRMNQTDINYLIHLTERADTDDLIHFYCYTLQKIRNPLALNLFWEVSLFQGFPFARLDSHPVQYNSQLIQKRLRKLISFVQKNDWDNVQSFLTKFQRSDVCVIKKIMEPFIHRIPKEDQVPFVWRVYRKRPQICYNLASCILHSIYIGEYRNIQFLPSYEKMAESYDVSVSTMRRTISMLNQIGACKTINGKGTRLFTIGERCPEPNFKSPIVRLNLSFFVQSFELLIYSCNNVTVYFLSSLSQTKKVNLLRDLETCFDEGRCELSLWHYLLYVSENSSLSGIRVMYKTIYSLFLWGYPLKASSVDSSILDQAVIQFTESMIHHLRKDEFNQCAEDVRHLLSMQLLAAKKYLTKHGIPFEELQNNSSIRFY